MKKTWVEKKSLNKHGLKVKKRLTKSLAISVRSQLQSAELICFHSLIFVLIYPTLMLEKFQDFY